MNLLTLDEARTERRHLDEAATAALRDPKRVGDCGDAVGRRRHRGFSVRDRVLAGPHRRVLDEVIALGYGAEAADELAGISSAEGFDADSIDPAA
jgi:hypothetical protein